MRRGSALGPGPLSALGIALCFYVATACEPAQAQGPGSFPGTRLDGGDALLVAGVQEPTAEGFDQTQQVCFRTRATPTEQLGCVQRAAFIVVGEGAFQFDGKLFTVADTLPPAAQNVNFVAVLRVDRDAAFDVVARSVDEDNAEFEREDFLTFAEFVPPPPPPPVDPGPAAPILILIEELQGALDRAQERIAAEHD